MKSIYQNLMIVAIAIIVINSLAYFFDNNALCLLNLFPLLLLFGIVVDAIAVRFARLK